MNSDAGAFGTVFVLLLGILYFLIAFFFIGWVISVRMRLPAFAQTQVMMGMLGLFKKLSTELETKYCEVNGVAPPSAAANAKPAAQQSNNAAAQGKNSN